MPHFVLASIRPSVLSTFYRATGDLRQVKAIVNHVNLSTTVGYVQGPEVEAQNHVRVAALQSAFVGHIEYPTQSERLPKQNKSTRPSGARSPPPTAAAVSQRSSTVAEYFLQLRGLVQWMDTEGCRRFSDLDSAALPRFQSVVARRKRNTGTTVTPITVQQNVCLLVYLYRFRDEIDNALLINPCPGQSAFGFVGVRRRDGRKWPYTPDAIAVPLIQGAIEVRSGGLRTRYGALGRATVGGWPQRTSGLGALMPVPVPRRGLE